MIVLTSGKKYLDIDGYASCLAYRELLKMQGIDSKFVSTATPNYSVTESLLNLPFHLDKYELRPDDKFIIIDLSNKAFFENFVQEDNVVELIDHHPGFENYWTDKLKENAHIEQVGAVATIIAEKYEQYNLLNSMDKDIAKLLMAAILDNTLNFTAKATKQRDIDVYSKLEILTNCFDFRSTYFGEVQNFIEKDLVNAIVNDMKLEETCEYLPKTLGQLTIYDISTILAKFELIKNTMNKYDKNWLINIISLKENKSYIVCSDEEVTDNLIKMFNMTSTNNIVVLQPSILRKEIIKTALEMSKNVSYRK